MMIFYPGLLALVRVFCDDEKRSLAKSRCLSRLPRAGRVQPRPGLDAWVAGDHLHVYSRRIHHARLRSLFIADVVCPAAHFLEQN